MTTSTVVYAQFAQRSRRVGLRGREADRSGGDPAVTARAVAEFWEEDLPGLCDPAT